MIPEPCDVRTCCRSQTLVARATYSNFCFRFNQLLFVPFPGIFPCMKCETKIKSTLALLLHDPRHGHPRLSGDGCTRPGCAARHFSYRFHNEWSGALVVGRYERRLHDPSPLFGRERGMAKRAHAIPMAVAIDELERCTVNLACATVLSRAGRNAADARTGETPDEQHRRPAFDEPSAQRHARPRCEWLRQSPVSSYPAQVHLRDDRSLRLVH